MVASDENKISKQEYEEYLKPLYSFMEKTNRESDLGVTLVTASMLDNMLEQIIRSYLLLNSATEKLFNGAFAPISSFSARISVSRSLGLIDEVEYSDLEKLRKIRNHFAHDLNASFDDNNVIDACKNLRTKAHDHSKISGETIVISPRGQFISAAISVVNRLYNRAVYVERSRLTEKRWKL